MSDYLTLKALAVYSGLSTRSLRRYLTHPVGPLPHFRINQKILVRREEFDTWMRQFRQTSEGVDRLVDAALSGLRS